MASSALAFSPGSGVPHSRVRLGSQPGAWSLGSAFPRLSLHSRCVRLTAVWSPTCCDTTSGKENHRFCTCAGDRGGRARTGRKGNLVPVGEGVNLVPSALETVWRFLRKLKIELPYDSAIPSLSMLCQVASVVSDSV